MVETSVREWLEVFIGLTLAGLLLVVLGLIWLVVLAVSQRRSGLVVHYFPALFLVGMGLLLLFRWTVLSWLFGGG